MGCSGIPVTTVRRLGVKVSVCTEHSTDHSCVWVCKCVCVCVCVCECVCVEEQFEAFVKCRWRFLQNRSLMTGLVPEASLWPVIKMSMYHTVSRVKLLWGGGRGNVCLLKFDISLDLERSNKFFVQIGYLYLIVLGLIMWLLYLNFKKQWITKPQTEI